MRSELKEVTLETVGMGGVPELFAHEWANILANVDDPNTSPEAVRKLTIEIAIKPSEQRDNATVQVSVKSKLAGVRPIQTIVHLAKEQGRLIALTTDPAPTLFEGISNVVPIEGGSHNG